ncbi:peptide deformylase [Flavobacteriaceae bacterium]|nr:peptide deformylase [Flavobacteriaceae bacterium]MDB4067133.1 peptide deformylase [Flavobacteriaceae bacterium]MDB9988329.1 peptide deformylase [Flavobacteriaceae bacterium]|tara:strand:+ start:438 stop:1025 length:588 start_codon:yes stop_codon:yes gene_type:complete
MILPIVAYGTPVLKKKGTDITPEYPAFDQLLQNMWETMYAANGVGLAAPQVGIGIRLFIVDASPFADDDALTEEEQKQLTGFKKVFINPQIEESGEEWAFNEGCLSIPDVREDVYRQEVIHIRYWDENFKEHQEVYTGLAARVIQHEYDHIEGVLFTDKLSPLKKRLIKGKLNNIAKGNIDVDYKMRFPLASKKR